MSFLLAIIGCMLFVCFVIHRVEDADVLAGVGEFDAAFFKEFEDFIVDFGGDDLFSFVILLAEPEPEFKVNGRVREFGEEDPGLGFIEDFWILGLDVLQGLEEELAGQLEV